jgi:hypothetical protein|tara:strand:- start:1480 stop:1719 length:240 start_codon:yes stop_codon:yes gene_type:complete
MTKEFIEIVLTKLLNQREMVELDMRLLLKREDISTDEKSDMAIVLIDDLTKANNNIEAFSGMIPEDVLSTPLNEENNNK